jgi:hypothetical protein
MNIVVCSFRRRAHCARRIDLHTPRLSLSRTICTLLKLNICSNDRSMTSYLEETIKARLQTDISDSFHVHSFVFNDKEDIQFNVVREFRDYVRRLADSMSVIEDYSKLFALFNINYIKVCFFESNSAADQVGSRLLLTY